MTTEPLFRILAALSALVGLTLAAGPALSPASRAPKVLTIDVTDKGFVPERLRVSQREPVTLLFTRRTDRVCSGGVSVQLDPRDPDSHVLLELELNKALAMTLHFSIRGTYVLSCPASTIRGRLIAE